MTEKNGKIRVLVVDDSAFMRVALKQMMETDSLIEVSDVARNGEEALEIIRKRKPDIVTLDIQMPVMDGLTALRQIMKEMPLPVIMISAITEEGAEATLEALELGAIDFIPKGGKSFVNLDIVKVGEELRQKVRAIVSQHRLKSLSGNAIFQRQEKQLLEKEVPSVLSFEKKDLKKCQIVTIGVSTGGPLALNYMIPKIPRSFSSSILIVQHMPPTFTRSFAQKLDMLSQISVKEAADGDVPEPGFAYIARGGVHMKGKSEDVNKMRIVLDPEPSELLFVPSVDVMMLSVAQSFHGRILGIIMTGMGCDGLHGMAQIKKMGGVTLAQEKDSCVVYGMPRVCVDSGIIDCVVSLDQMAEEITTLAG